MDESKSVTASTILGEVSKRRPKKKWCAVEGEQILEQNCSHQQDSK